MTLLHEPPSDLAEHYVGEPFVPYAEPLDVNWSDDLEALHEESSRDHFLDVWTRRAIRESLAGEVPESGVVVDAGCSSGYLLEDLHADHPSATLLGVDLIAAGLRRAATSVPQARLILGDVCNLPLHDSVANAVVSANLLEHVADDVGAISEFFRILKPGGLAAVVAPAGPGVYDYYDAFLDHERRYARRELAGKARSVGFEVILDTFLGTFIFPAFWAIKKFNRLRHAGVSAVEARALVARNIDRTKNSRLGASTCKVERTLLRRGVRMPFGVRGFTVMRRPT